MGIETGRFADIDGPVHFREWDGPAGRTFVLIHGLGGSHLDWLSVADGLADRGRVVALDLPGFGLSPRAGRSATLRANRELVAQFIRERDFGPVILGGNSMGGSVAIMQAGLEPESVAGLVLSSPAVPWARGGHPSPLVMFAFATYAIPGAGELLGGLRIKGMTPERVVRWSFKVCTADSASIRPEVVSQQLEMARLHRADPELARTFLEAARSLLREGARRKRAVSLMDRITCPVLLVHGELDRLVPRAWAMHAARGRERWRLELFSDLGHVIQMEAPESWLAAVGSWMDSELPATKPS